MEISHHMLEPNSRSRYRSNNDRKSAVANHVVISYHIEISDYR